MTNISINKAAAILNLHVDTLRDLDRRGILIANKTTGGHRRYNSLEVFKLANKKNGNLTKFERTMLATNYWILALGNSKEKAEWERKAEAVLYGYEAEYFLDMDDDVLSSDDCHEVSAIMQMYWIGQREYQKLDDKSGITEYHMTNLGFSDDNRAGYARYRKNEDGQELFQGLVSECKDFTKMVPNGLEMARYRKMLLRWNSIQKNKNIGKFVDKEDLIEVFVNTH
jgi:uncharacterized protein YfbU (UPF0304 family)